MIFKKPVQNKKEVIIKELNLGKTIKLPNGEVIEKTDIISITPDGEIIYISSDGTLKTVKLNNHSHQITTDKNILFV